MKQEMLKMPIWIGIQEISLIRIGDSGQAEAVRRKLDTHTSKELPKLKKQRGIKNDEITGEPLGKNAAFHHSNEKELFTVRSIFSMKIKVLM